MSDQTAAKTAEWDQETAASAAILEERWLRPLRDDIARSGERAAAAHLSLRFMRMMAIAPVAACGGFMTAMLTIVRGEKPQPTEPDAAAPAGFAVELHGRAQPDFYGPFGAEADAAEFAAFLTAEVDPATVVPAPAPGARLRNPVDELLAWWRHKTDPTGGVPW